ncbi:MAG: hypothetical protein Ct9H300mP19_14500 [Dehalococcoidia bacterium]|nr:MAG: hypothetical protein Ct9H300mP19_14500 [Dehalococcoidia bacterium]
MITENWRPAKWLEQPPMVIGIFQHDTRVMPMKAVIDDLESVLRWPGVVGGSVGQGYPWSDVPGKKVSRAMPCTRIQPNRLRKQLSGSRDGPGRIEKSYTSLRAQTIRSGCIRIRKSQF